MEVLWKAPPPFVWLPLVIVIVIILALVLLFLIIRKWYKWNAANNHVKLGSHPKIKKSTWDVENNLKLEEIKKEVQKLDRNFKKDSRENINVILKSTGENVTHKLTENENVRVTNEKTDKKFVLNKSLIGIKSDLDIRDKEITSLESNKLPKVINEKTKKEFQKRVDMAAEIVESQLNFEPPENASEEDKKALMKEKHKLVWTVAKDENLV